MLDGVRSWALTVCFACVIGSVMAMMFPSGSSKKLLRMMISMMILCVIFKPVVSIGSFILRLDEDKFSVSRYRNEELEDSVVRNAAEIYSAYITENTRRVLDGSGISYENVAVNMDISEDGSISIGQVEVIVQNEDVEQTEKIRRLLLNYTGQEPVITVKGSE